MVCCFQKWIALSQYLHDEIMTWIPLPHIGPIIECLSFGILFVPYVLCGTSTSVNRFANKSNPFVACPYAIDRLGAIRARPHNKTSWYLEAARLGFTLQWRHNGRDGDSNHQPHACLLNRLFRCRSKKTSKLHVTGLCAGNFPHKWPVTRMFPMFPLDDVIIQCCYIAVKFDRCLCYFLANQYSKWSALLKNITCIIVLSTWWNHDTFSTFLALLGGRGKETELHKLGDEQSRYMWVLVMEVVCGYLIYIYHIYIIYIYCRSIFSAKASGGIVVASLPTVNLLKTWIAKLYMIVLIDMQRKEAKQLHKPMLSVSLSIGPLGATFIEMWRYRLHNRG